MEVSVSFVLLFHNSVRHLLLGRLDEKYSFKVAKVDGATLLTTPGVSNSRACWLHTGSYRLRHISHQNPSFISLFPTLSPILSLPKFSLVV